MRIFIIKKRRNLREDSARSFWFFYCQYWTNLPDVSRIYIVHLEYASVLFIKDAAFISFLETFIKELITQQTFTCSISTTENKKKV